MYIYIWYLYIYTYVYTYMYMYVLVRQPLKQNVGANVADVCSDV